MSTNFQPIFDYIDKTKAEILSDVFEQVATKNDIKTIKDMLEAFAKSTSDNVGKLAVQENKTERIEHWV